MNNLQFLDAFPVKKHMSHTPEELGKNPWPPSMLVPWQLGHCNRDAKSGSGLSCFKPGQLAAPRSTNHSNILGSFNWETWWGMGKMYACWGKMNSDGCDILSYNHKHIH